MTKGKVYRVGRKSATASIVDAHRGVLERKVKAARKYKINRPSMLQRLRSDAWYKFQYYDPLDKRSDDLGYIHFKSRARMDDHIRGRVRATKHITPLEWILLGASWAAMIATIVWWFVRGV